MTIRTLAFSIGAAFLVSTTGCAGVSEDESADVEMGEEAETAADEQELAGALGDRTYTLAAQDEAQLWLKRLRLDINEPAPQTPTRTFTRTRLDHCHLGGCAYIKETGRWSLTRDSATGQRFIKFTLGIQDTLGRDRYEYKRTATGLKLRWVGAQDMGEWFPMRAVD